ncbi:MAG: protein kinase [Proteobacteria bacterium]|nr:protein kinase [Pseudomonadota bacterium]MBU1737459.1 protein kinase [Pseudomonadota bacterium]
MHIKTLLTSSWFSCTFLTLLMIVGLTAEAPLLERAENSIYDRLAAFHKIDKSGQVVLVAIDQDSIGRLGSWPWPRSVISEAIDRLVKTNVKAIGLDLHYPARETGEGIKEIARLKEYLADKKLDLPKNTRQELSRSLAAAENRLDNDSRLLNSVHKGGKIILPLQFYFGSREWVDDSTNPAWLKKHAIDYPKETLSAGHSLFQLGNPFNGEKSPVQATGFSAPFTDLAESAAGLGHDNFIGDRDRTVRGANLFISWQEKLYPSMALRLSLAALDSRLQDIRGTYNKASINSLNFADRIIPVNGEYRLLMAGNRPESFVTFPFHAIQEGKIGRQELAGKTVVLGLTAPGLTTFFKTTEGEEISTAELTAITTAAILAGNHISRPGWTWSLETGALLYFGLFLIFIIPRVNLSLGTIILIIFIISWQALATLLFVSQGIWIKSASPTILAVIGLVLIIINRKFFNPFRTATDDEANKVLGLSFQSQGLLDLAFEKFMKCPVSDPSVKDLLYNLGLDLERKRMHNKAIAVYEHIYRCGPFKDIKEKIERLKVTAKIPSFAKPNSTTLSMTTTSDAKPTLGRYEILEEIGQGAIGTVYLGRDPKINRAVAIKTLRYDQVDKADLAEVKARFFREAEAAGKLNHPNIVTIYDIDEDHDMTYMAMELLNGQDLSAHCKTGNLLPVPKVLEIIIKVAEALEYAHKNHVVHRDVKPANIILLKDGHVKVADFGIARILDSSKTQTGVILGTPNYMSPEQVAGKKVDGSSDQFSLGVVLYELLTGTKPFRNSNVAALMHSISTVSYTPLQEVDPGLPECCIKLATRLMSKAKSRRFETIGEVVVEARKCLREFNKQ